MPREAEISLNEREFILRALGENVRLDGRTLEDLRPLELSFGDEYGVADVRLGKTRYVMIFSGTEMFVLNIARVLARISAEVTQPFPDRRFDGIFTIVTELSPMASPAFETGRYVLHPLLRFPTAPFAASYHSLTGTKLQIDRPGDDSVSPP